MTADSTIDTIPPTVPAKPATTPAILRTKDFKMFMRVKSPAWGIYYRQAQEDPSGINPKDLPPLQLVDNFPRIPANLFTAWVKLAQHFSKVTIKEATNPNGSYEVQCLLLRKEPDFREWRIVIPTQIVTGATVDAQTENWIDLITGEKGKGFPPMGYVYAGSFHSHNTMSAFWSSRDDSFELNAPGLHATFGKLDGNKGYQVCSSIVLSFQRHVLEAEKLIDQTWLEAVTFHPDVLNYVHIKKPVVYHEPNLERIRNGQADDELYGDHSQWFLPEKDSPTRKRYSNGGASFGFTQFGAGPNARQKIDLGDGVTSTRTIEVKEGEDLSEVIGIIKSSYDGGEIFDDEADELLDVAIGIHRAYRKNNQELLYKILDLLVDTEELLTYQEEGTLAPEGLTEEEQDDKNLVDPFFYM